MTKAKKFKDKETTAIMPVYTGSAALEFEYSFDPFNSHYFDQFQKNLRSLEEKVSLLSFMVEEVQEVISLQNNR